jgi:hypothetical protein
MLDRTSQNPKNRRSETVPGVSTIETYKRPKARSPLLLILALIIVLFSLNASAAEQGLFWGRVQDDQRRPLSGANVTLSFAVSGLVLRVESDGSGQFRVGGLPLGLFSARVEAKGFKPYEETRLVSEPASSIYIELAMSPLAAKGGASTAIVRPSVNNYSQTILTHSRVDRLPTGNNVWHLIENLDLSATTNRIDIGGLWTGVPALFSGRGSVSWTQSRWLLNGMDVTDPYKTGAPLFYPDFFGWGAMRLVNADLPMQGFGPGAYLEMTSPEERREFHGGFSAFYSDKTLSSKNITPALEKEHLFDSNSLRRLADFNLVLTGPVSRAASFFVSATSQSVSRHLAGFNGVNESSILSGTTGLRFDVSDSSSLRFFWTGQTIHSPTMGGGRGIDPAATLDSRYATHVLQMLWDQRFSASHTLKAGIGLASGSLSSDFQAGAEGPNSSDLFLGHDAGSASMAGQDARLLINGFVDGQALLRSSSVVQHHIQYGLALQYASASSHKEVRDDRHLVFFDGQPLQVITFNTPTDDREAAFHLNVYAQEMLMLGSRVALSAGLNLGFSHAWVPGSPASARPGWSGVTPSAGGAITWLNVSPRLALTFPLAEKSLSAIRISAARYYYALPLSDLTYGNPGAWGGLVYSWNDANGDGRFQAGEAGTLLRRQGPLFAGIDPDIKRPSVDELMIALNLDLGKTWAFSIAGFLRETRNLAAALNTGVPFSSYAPVIVHDAGDDMIPGTYDDLTFTVYDQKPGTLGQDFFLLTNADSEARVNRYRGADVTLARRPGEPFDFFFSFQAIEAIGSANPGNTEMENDDGVIGNLYADPNTLINARGRLRFDRGFTVRVGFSFEAFWGIRFGSVIKYYDGQPFTRKIIIPGFAQGPFMIMAHARGVARYEYNRNVDVRLEKVFPIKGSRLRLILDGFNIFNRSLATEENEWTGPDFPRRFPTEIMSPRLFRLGLAFEF